MSSQSQFLEKLFNCIDVKDYCVLRNYESLPDSLNGRDLDLMVRSEDLDKITNILESIVQSVGGKVISKYNSSGRYFRILGQSDGEWWSAAVDLMPSINYRGIIYISSDRIIKRSCEYKGISVVGEKDIAVISLLKELVHNGKSRKTYFEDACSVYKKFRESSLDSLDAHFSKDFRRYLAGVLEAGEEDKETIRLLVKKMRAELYSRQLIKQFRGFFLNQIYRFSRLFKPVGMSIAVVGTDGAGKTTIINKITPILEEATQLAIHYEHMRPNWIPALGKVVCTEEATGEVVTDPHRKQASGVVGSLVRLTYYSLDYLLGYWIKTHPRIVKKSQICLFDRYYYDIIIDPLRMRLKLPQVILRAWFFLCPQPQLILCLGADPESIYKRKPETSLEEVIRQVSMLKLLCAYNERAYWIDTGNGIEASVDDTLQVIQNVMSSIRGDES